MVSNVLKPSPSGRGMPTNGAAAGAAREVVGSNTKVETKIKKLRQNGIVNGCSAESHNGSSSPSPPPETKIPPTTTLTSNQTKTQGAHSNEESSSTTTLGDQSQRRRLVCPELAIRYTGTLMSNRAGHLVGSQRDLESRYTALTRKLRQKQLRGVQSHARKQLDFSNKTSSGRVNTASNEASAPLLKSESELSDMSNEIASDKSEPMELELQRREHSDQPLPIQVDGACDEQPNLSSNLRELSLAIASGRKAGEDGVKEPYHDTLLQADKDDVFRENESCVGIPEPSFKPGSGRFDNSMKRIRQQLTDLRNLMDGDVTESSDDEEEDDRETSRRESSKRNWERTRSLVGSRWAWLNHRLTTLNKDLCRLEHEIQHRPNKERFSFSLPESTTQPSWLALSNSSILSHLNKTSTNGSTPASILSSSLASLQQKGTAGKNAAVGVKPSNGYTNNHKSIPSGGRNGGSGGHGQYYSQLLLSESGIGAKLQVKDLLSPARNFILVDEPGCTSARTRALERKARRRIVRKRQELKRQQSTCRHDDTGCGITSCTGLDPSPHPILSLPHELPSRVLLDAAVKRVLAEHSYAQLPLNKRRKAAAKLAHISTPRSVLHSRALSDHASRMHHDHTSFSESPSPLGTPLSASSDRVKGGSSRKRPSLIHQSSSSCDTPGPWSPSIFRPHTPLNNTPSLPISKKRRLMSSTPSYDIDNIVIPYSMASTTRVEKLEYKEIITPSWREVDAEKLANEEVQNKPMDMEECHDKKDTETMEPQQTATDEQTDERNDKDGVDKTIASSSEVPPTDHTPLPEDTSEGEEDMSDEAYTRRHEKCESIEKQKFLNFISGGSRKRTRPHSLASTPDANTARASSPHPLAAAVASSNKGKQKRVLLSPTPSEVELAMIQREVTVLPWTQREFPLNEQDYDALLHPPPPPKLVAVTPSPSPMDTRSTTPTDFKLSRTPSNTSITAATPLSSPLSTPSEETPAISPSEWTVQLNAQTTQPKATSHFPSLVLRLSKRTV